MSDQFRIVEHHFADRIGDTLRLTIRFLDELEPVALEFEGIEEVIRDNFDTDRATAALAAVRRFLAGTAIMSTS